MDESDPVFCAMINAARDEYIRVKGYAPYTADIILILNAALAAQPAAPVGEEYRSLVAKAIYAGWLHADLCTENHFQWFEAGKGNPDSCVHYSNVAKALKVADRVLALAAPPPSTQKVRDVDVEAIAREIAPYTGAISVVCGEVATYYAGFNLSEFARRILSTNPGEQE